MSTRSIIAMEDNEGMLTTVSAISCHYAGNPEHNGVILSQNYTDPNKVRKLISLGNLDYLGSKIEPDKTTKKFGASWQDGTNPEYKQLINTLSELKPDLATKVDLELRNSARDHTIAYQRDCDQGGNQCHSYNSVDELMNDNSDYMLCVEYIYLFRNDNWSFYDVAKGKWNKLN